MRYIFYILTLSLVFAAGMMIGNSYLPQHGVSEAAAVSAPDLSNANPILSATDRTAAERELNVLSDALQVCPSVSAAEKDALVNHIKLWLALEDFRVKKMRLELEITKNITTNRATSHLTQAAADYNTARAYAEKMADELFPATDEPVINPTQVTTVISSPAASAPAAAKAAAPKQAAEAKPAKEEPKAEEKSEPAEKDAKAADKQTKPAEKPAEKAAEKSAEKQETKPAEKPSEKSAEKPTDKVTEKADAKAAEPAAPKA